MPYSLFDLLGVFGEVSPLEAREVQKAIVNRRDSVG